VNSSVVRPYSAACVLFEKWTLMAGVVGDEMLVLVDPDRRMLRVLSMDGIRTCFVEI
jgi:hypothetical protein